MVRGDRAEFKQFATLRKRFFGQGAASTWITGAGALPWEKNESPEFIPCFGLREGHRLPWQIAPT